MHMTKFFFQGLTNALKLQKTKTAAGGSSDKINLLDVKVYGNNHSKDFSRSLLLQERDLHATS